MSIFQRRQTGIVEAHGIILTLLGRAVSEHEAQMNPVHFFQRNSDLQNAMKELDSVDDLKSSSDAVFCQKRCERDLYCSSRPFSKKLQKRLVEADSP